MMTRKVCPQCKEEKPTGDFYLNCNMSDGHFAKCKECTKYNVREHRRTHDSVREYDRRRYREDPERRASTNERTKARAVAKPQQKKATTAVSNAVRDGRLAKPCRCSRCGEKARRIEGHHEDYSKPLEVIWLCTLCHRRYT